MCTSMLLLNLRQIPDQDFHLGCSEHYIHEQKTYLHSLRVSLCLAFSIVMPILDLLARITNVRQKRTDHLHQI